MTKKSDFEVMTEMINQGLEIACLPHLVSAQAAQSSGHIAKGIDASWLHKVAQMPMKYRCIWYIVNKEEFDAIQAANTPIVKVNPAQECQELTLPEAWKKLHELVDSETTSVDYEDIPAAFLPDLKAFEVGRTQSDLAGPGTIDRRVFVDWLLKIFYRGFDYQIHFKTDTTTL